MAQILETRQALSIAEEPAVESLKSQNPGVFEDSEVSATRKKSV